jgi:hypothetical protein
MDTTLKKKVAKLVRLLGTTEHGERANAWRMLMYKMQDVGVNWSDVGNWIEEGDAHNALNQVLQKNGVSPDAVAGWIKGGGEDDFRAIYDAGLQEASGAAWSRRRAKAMVMPMVI